MDGHSDRADGPGGSSIEEYERFERWWDEKKASMSPGEFERWRAANSCQLIPSEQIVQQALDELKRNLLFGKTPVRLFDQFGREIYVPSSAPKVGETINVRRPPRFRP